MNDAVYSFKHKWSTQKTWKSCQIKYHRPYYTWNNNETVNSSSKTACYKNKLCKHIQSHAGLVMWIENISRQN